MENIVQSNNRDLRLVAVKVGVLSTLRLVLPDVPANATRVEVIVTNGDTHTAYGAQLDTDTERWLVDVAAAQFPSCGNQKYEIAYLLDGKQFWDGAGWVTVEDATTGGLTPSPSPDPARYVVTRINGYGAPNPDGEVRIPCTFVGTEDPNTTDTFIEFDQFFNRITGALFVLCSVVGTLTWVKTAGAVFSVNGMVGVVKLTADDVLNDAQKEAANSGIKEDLVPKVLTIDETTETKKIVLGDKTFTSFAELTALVQNGVTRLKYHVTYASGRPVLYTAHLCDARTIRFDATGTIGETVYTRSIAITKNGDDGIAVSVGELTQVAKASELAGKLNINWNSETSFGWGERDSAIGYRAEYYDNAILIADASWGPYFIVRINGTNYTLTFPNQGGRVVLSDENTNELPEPIKTALFAGADFIAAVKKYGGTQIKEDEKGFYYEVDEEA